MVGTAGGRVTRLGVWCPALDLDTKECMIYGWRHTKEARALCGGLECSRVWPRVWMGAFPRWCGYVRWYHPAWDEGDMGVCDLDAWSDILARSARLRAVIRERVAVRNES